MTKTAAQSVFDVAEWFIDTALNDKEYLQPAKMQFLMFLSQGYYAAMTGGEMLMPSVFIATDRGPVEPNSYKIYASGRPLVKKTAFDRTTEALLQTIWRKYGAHSADYLARLIATHEPYAAAFAKGEGSVIDINEMTDFYMQGKNTPATPAAEKFAGTKVMRSQTGKAVAVKKWLPKKKA